MAFKRNMTEQTIAALADTRIVVINGARQTGKSTFVGELLAEDYAKEYLTLDDASTLSAAQNEPEAFLKLLETPAIIDEVQRAPELFLSLKKIVDKQRKPGQFLLTGSTNVLNLPKIADSLAGRMEIQTLWPLSQGEIAGHKEQVIDELFAEKIPLGKKSSKKGITPDDLLNRILIGGYPEVVLRPTTERRSKWFESYLTAIIQRDIRDLANIDGLRDIPLLLQLLAERAGNLINFADVSRVCGISATTLKRYVNLLENVFLTVLLPAWFTNKEKRLIKTPKIFLNDTGLLCHLQKVDAQALENNRTLLGPILENFVFMELKKQSTWSKTQPQLYYFRSHSNQEVDFILEAPNGKTVAIEVKSSATIKADDFNGIKTFAELNTKCIAGIVLYTGEKTLAFGENLYAVPVNALWET
ncbi:MAG: ATP-binding protein [Gammaproteobacteria bacterium]|nr:ATP-binding protein [Gammaproteobacteria bacterium]